MTIRWDSERRKWLMIGADISNEEWHHLYFCHNCPQYWDNYDEGEVYFYPPNLSVGDLYDDLDQADFSLNIVFGLERGY